MARQNSTPQILINSQKRDRFIFNKSFYDLIPYDEDLSTNYYCVTYIDKTKSWIKLIIKKEYDDDCLLLSKNKRQPQYSLSIKHITSAFGDSLLSMKKYKVYSDLLTLENVFYINLKNNSYKNEVCNYEWTLIPPVRGVRVTDVHLMSGTVAKNKHIGNKYINNIPYIFSYTNYGYMLNEFHKQFYLKYNASTNEIYIKLIDDIFNQGNKITYRLNNISISLNSTMLGVISTKMKKPFDFDDIYNLPKHVYLKIEKHPTMEDTLIIKDIYTQKACVLKSSTCEEE